MLAMVVSRPGGPEVLERREVPDPVIGPLDLLVEVRATAVNRADLLQRRGLYPAPPGSPPDIPGLEFAGRVIERGAGVRGWREGDRVMAIAGGGAYAERIAAPAATCLRIPEGMGWEEAAAIPEAFLTAYDALAIRGRLAAGEAVLIAAAASGVGTAAIQLARLNGGHVVALSRSAGKRERLAGLGADSVLDSSDPAAPARIREATGGRGIDVVIDLAGAALWPLYLEVLAELGRVVVVGTMSGSRIELDLGVLMRRRATVVGTVLRGRPVEEKAALAAAFEREVLPQFARGAVRAVIDRVLPLHAAADAHRVLEANANFGKVVLTLGA